jgi:membrane associated rhomboid family serine protease
VDPLGILSRTSPSIPVRLSFERYRTTTNILILSIVFSFVLQFIYEGYLDAFLFSIDYIVYQPYRFFTASFLHLNLLHLSLNMYALFIFGNVLEKEAGYKEMLILFFLGSLAGIGGYLLLAGFGLERFMSLIGASDSISALLGACVFLASKKEIEVFFIKMKVRTALILILTYDILGVFHIFAFQPNVIYSTHFSALIFGYFYAKFLIKTSVQKSSSIHNRP